MSSLAEADVGDYVGDASATQVHESDFSKYIMRNIFSSALKKEYGGDEGKDQHLNLLLSWLKG